MQKYVILAAIMSLILYAAGVLSGLYASKIIKQQTEQDLDTIKLSMEGFRSNLENIQIQQNFFNVLSDNENCNYSQLAMDYMVDELSYFWQKLPYRLEEYEQTHIEDEDYKKIKREYSFLALKAWIIATQNYDSCSSNLIPILYFYSSECKECITQGMYIDRLKQDLNNRNVIAFAIDSSLNESSIELIKKYYHVTSSPELIISNEVLQGRAFNETEIAAIIS